MKSEFLPDKEIRKFAEQIQLPGIGLVGQEKIKRARILVIGAGGKGTSVLSSLMAAGIGHVGITDNFLIDEACLPRQSLYGEKDLGRQRAIAARQRLQESGNGTEFTLYNICLSETNIQEIIKPYTLLVDATDNFAAHYLINDAALAAHKPFVYGAVVHNTGLVTLFNHQGGPSFRCLYPHVPKDKSRYTDTGLPGLGLLYSLTGTLMAAEALKVVLGIPTSLNGKLLHVDAETYTSSFEPITRNEENFKLTDPG